MTVKNSRIFKLDNSGHIHLAVLNSRRSNTFRISVTLDRQVDPAALQAALEAVTPRFPSLVAGIRRSLCFHLVNAVDAPPKVRKDEGPLKHMPFSEIRQCAMRVLCKSNTISVEFFHSITDGYGGFEFTKTLLAEYLRTAHDVNCFDGSRVLSLETSPQEHESMDSYITYAGNKKSSFNNIKSYLPGEGTLCPEIETTTGIFDVRNVLTAAHEYDVSMTAFLTAVMAKSIMELQLHNHKHGLDIKPVQIMVPADLRRIFPSKTLRNFSLYALPKVSYDDFHMDFGQLAKHIEGQMNDQFEKEKLAAMMATSISFESNPVLKYMPLVLKSAALKAGFHFVGKRQSSITLSNIGRIVLPEGMETFVTGIREFLTPRACSPYNCVTASYKDKLYFNFTRGSRHSELEPVFFHNMQELGCSADLEVNGIPVSLEKYLSDARFPVFKRPVFCYNK